MRRAIAVTIDGYLHHPPQDDADVDIIRSCTRALANDCGCVVGGTFLVLTAVAAITHLFAFGHLTATTVSVAVAATFASAIVGKSGGHRRGWRAVTSASGQSEFAVGAHFWQVPGTIRHRILFVINASRICASSPAAGAEHVQPARTRPVDRTVPQHPHRNRRCNLHDRCEALDTLRHRFPPIGKIAPRMRQK